LPSEGLLIRTEDHDNDHDAIVRGGICGGIAARDALDYPYIDRESLHLSAPAGGVTLADAFASATWRLKYRSSLVIRPILSRSLEFLAAFNLAQRDYLVRATRLPSFE
jgi:hypothetical protein